MTSSPTRDAIVEAADQLFYRSGFAHTSFAHIADAVGISRGNFYYHFRSKDEILDAVIAARVGQTQAMLDAWESAGTDAVARIRCFVHLLVRNRADIRRFGCPVGTLTSELAKLGHPAMPQARGLFEMFRRWLRRQFEQLGCGAGSDALAMHLLARSQGVATLANALPDDAFVAREVQEMNAWLDATIASMPASRATPSGRAVPTRLRRSKASP